MSPTTTTANGNSTVPTTGTASAASATFSSPSSTAATLKQRNVSKDLGTNTLLLDLCTPPKFETIEEDRTYIKERLAAAFRIFAKLGLDHAVAGHLSVRDPGDPESFWVNPFGLAWTIITVSDLIRVDKEGFVIEGGKPGRQIVNRAGFLIHSAIHAARPEVNAVCHSHSTYGKAFSTLRRSLPITTQDACSFYNDIALYDQFGGIALEDDEGINISRALGNKKAAILQNHGLLTVGTSIDTAIAWFILLEKECEVLLLAEAANHGQSIVEVDPDDAAFTYKHTGNEAIGYFLASPYFQVIEAECGESYRK